MQSVAWNWQEGVAYLRFGDGERPEENAIRDAVEEGTPLSMGEIRYLHALSELPFALR